MIHRPGFTGSPLDRVDHLRANEAAFADFCSDWRARLLTLDGLDPQIDEDGRLVWGSLAHAPDGGELILLGLIGERPHFAAITDHRGGMMRSPAMFRALTLLSADQAAIYGTARALIEWHNAHRFCGVCGSPTMLFRSGWGRKCSGCGKDHFPRTDPVVIMLAEHDGMALVGRQSRFPLRQYSALAGFLEPGESIEEAVRRELFEESGVRTAAVRYVASQPWPFGSQLMIACIAQADDPALTIDETEIEHAMWVSRHDVIAALERRDDSPFLAPPPFAIAHTLLKAWVAGA